MKFRLIIPQCHNFSGWWCENSKNIESRLEVLQNSMDNDEIDIIITSHNYFIFFPSCLVDIRKFVEKQIIKVLSPYMCDNMKKLCTSGSKRFLAKKEVHVCIIWGLISIKSILFQLL